MSSPIMPAQGPSGPPIQHPPASSDIDARTSAGIIQGAAPGVSATPASTGIGDVGSFIAQLAAGVSALRIEAGRGGPPPEVLDQIAAAGKIGEQLRDAGHELRFFTAPDGGRVRVEIHDRDGNSVGTISAAAAVELAAGSPLN